MLVKKNDTGISKIRTSFSVISVGNISIVLVCHLRSRRRVARRLGHTKVQVPVDLVEGRKDGRIGRTDMKDMKEGRI